jgi:hypothetical protein
MFFSAAILLSCSGARLTFNASVLLSISYIRNLLLRSRIVFLQTVRLFTICCCAGGKPVRGLTGQAARPALGSLGPWVSEAAGLTPKVCGNLHHAILVLRFEMKTLMLGPRLGY